MPPAIGRDLTGKVLSLLIAAAATLDTAAATAWNECERWGREDFAEVCCEQDSILTKCVIAEGGKASRYSWWNGYDFEKFSDVKRCLADIKAKKTRKVWIAPPCGPDSPMQNINQRTPEQRHDLSVKQARAHRIQRNMKWLFTQLARTDWCTPYLETSARCYA